VSLSQAEAMSDPVDKSATQQQPVVEESRAQSAVDSRSYNMHSYLLPLPGITEMVPGQQLRLFTSVLCFLILPSILFRLPVSSLLVSLLYINVTHVGF